MKVERAPTQTGPTRLKPTERSPVLKHELLSRLDRLEGQMRGLKRMIDQNTYCIDILQQISAARRALDRLALILVRDHLGSCVSQAVIQNKPEEKIQELIETLDRFLS